MFSLQSFSTCFPKLAHIMPQRIPVPEMQRPTSIKDYCPYFLLLLFFPPHPSGLEEVQTFTNLGNVPDDKWPGLALRVRSGARSSLQVEKRRACPRTTFFLGWYSSHLVCCISGGLLPISLNYLKSHSKQSKENTVQCHFHAISVECSCNLNYNIVKINCTQIPFAERPNLWFW